MDSVVHEQVFSDLTGTTEYQYAYKKKCWTYFFMRGAEAYFRRFERRIPIYHNVADAQMWWARGFDWAHHTYGKRRIMNPESFFRGAMRGFRVTGATDQSLGWVTRLAFEHRSATGKKLILRSPNQMLSELNIRKDPTMGRKQSSNDLYKVKGKDIMGPRCGEDGDGNIILKVDGQYRGFPAAEIEKVVPHTIMVRSESEQYYGHYRAPKEKFMTGDIWLCSGDTGPFLLEVVRTNTQEEHVPELDDRLKLLKRLHGPERLKLESPAQDAVEETPAAPITDAVAETSQE